MRSRRNEISVQYQDDNKYNPTGLYMSHALCFLSGIFFIMEPILFENIAYI